MTPDRPLRVLFVTYGFFWDTTPKRLMPPTPNMIGVLKRCLRIIKHLPPGAFEALWVHYGNFDPADPLVREMSPLVPRYDPKTSSPWRTSPRLVRLFFQKRTLLRSAILGLVGILDLFDLRSTRSRRRSAERMLRGLHVDALVLGENPMGGQMHIVSRVARRLGILQVAIDNDLAPGHIEALHASSPQVDAWFLLGLGMSDALSPSPRPLATGPPLLAERGSVRAGDAAGLTILGYDPHVALEGARFLRECPAGTVGRLISPTLTPQRRRAYERAAGPAPLTFVASPDERQYRALLESSRVVFCKSGFQQIVESLAAGTPVVACEMSGGVDGYSFGGPMQPWVRFVAPSHAGWDEAVSAARQWLEVRPAMPWAPEIGALDSPVRRSAELFTEFLLQVVSRHADRHSCSPAS